MIEEEETEAKADAEGSRTLTKVGCSEPGEVQQQLQPIL